MTVLDRATQAARQVDLAPPRSAVHTRTRILAELRARSRRRRVMAYAMAGVVLLTAPGAWAAVRDHLAPWLETLAPKLGRNVAGSGSSHTRPATGAASTQAIPAAAPAGPPARPSGEPAPSPAARDAVPPPHAEPSAPTRSTPRPLRRQSASPESAQRRSSVSPRYLAAHRAHFVQRDPAQALAAWDAYLKAEPGDRFALEARYNRAICLVRLGRLAQARVALRPFAAGEQGGYRQRDAAALLRSLGSAR